MRKIKKINGFLVVRFNDREKREYEGTSLGEYGVIDAELYTGNLDIDRGAMEYDDADSLDVAIELARGLESEEDITDEPPTYTVVVETDTAFTETEVEPQLMISDLEHRLANQIKNRHYPDTDERTAAHELYGYKVALRDLGLLSECDCYVRPDVFGAYDIPKPLPQNSEELLTYICDEKCKERIPGRTQRELEAVCTKCSLERLAQEADARELRARENAIRDLNALLAQLDGTDAATATVRRVEFGARQYLKVLQTVGFLTEREIATFSTQIENVVKEWENTPATKPCCSYEDDGFRSISILAGDELASVSPHDYAETEVVEGCTVQVLKCRKCGHESFAWSPGTIGGERPYCPGKPGPSPYEAGGSARGEKE